MNRYLGFVSSCSFIAYIYSLDEVSFETKFEAKMRKWGRVGVSLACEAPSRDQLKPFDAVIEIGLAPYAGFTVWGPFGKRTQRQMEFVAWVGQGPGIMGNGEGVHPAPRPRLFRCPAALLARIP